MKKNILLITLLLIVISLNAQDYIATKKGDVIKAIVSEVTPTQISYKKFDNLNGPNYWINKSDVLSITYQNGEKDIFSENEEKTTTTTTTVTSSSEKSIVISKDNYMEEYAGFPINNDGWDFIINNGKEITRMNEDQYLRFVAVHCTSAKNIFNDGERNRKRANAFLTTGTVLAGLGTLAFTPINVVVTTNNHTSSTTFITVGQIIAGSSLIFIGAVFDFAVAVPLYRKSKRQKFSQSVYEYNNKCITKPISSDPTLKISPNGLALTF